MLTTIFRTIVSNRIQVKWGSVATKAAKSYAYDTIKPTINTVETSQNGQAVKRPPVITIMGHVDHGKTTLIDNLRRSKIVEQEFGGITQHIGAFVVPFKQNNTKELVTFLDTPGHAAFAAMRQRGANITDIVVLVVACDDGILDQTVESINYAKNSDVPIIVAINKIDKIKEERELQKCIEAIRRQLVVHDVIAEADGGDVQLVTISALQGTGIEYLKESILALAETLDLKAALDCPVSGRVIESQIDPHRGKTCTILVQQGVLRKGDYLIAGTSNWCRVRALFDERSQLRQECGPGLPIQVTGWRGADLPNAGEPVIEVENESIAKSTMNQFHQQRTHAMAVESAKEWEKRYAEYYKVYSKKLQEKRSAGLRYGRIFDSGVRGLRLPEANRDPSDSDRKINLILKCDVDGSLDAILDLLDTYDKNNTRAVKLNIIHSGVGSITENDYKLASGFPNSLIYGFNVKTTEQRILLQAKKEGVPLKLFNVIYHMVDDLKARICEKMPEQEREVELGRANVLQEFIINEGKRKQLPVAGCRVNKGIMKREDVYYKLMRNNQVIADKLTVNTLKHFKDDVKLIEKDKEFGISFQEVSGQQDQEINFRLGDVLICYEMQREKLKLRWDLKGFD